MVQVDPLRGEFTNWFLPNPEIKHLLVDMSKVPMLDSAGLGLLIAFLKQIRKRAGDLHFCGLQKRIGLVFDITRTKRLFGIHATREDALATIS